MSQSMVDEEREVVLRGWRAACDHAAAAAREWSSPARVSRPGPEAAPTRWFAIGDPQTTPERFLEVLARAGLLGEDGFLEPSVGLVSMGDHFDFGSADGADPELSGRAILAWLAAHPPAQVVILFGNHDAARVMELAEETNESYAEARRLAAAITRVKSAGGSVTDELQAFRARFPRIPTPDIAARDFASFSVAQRRMVQDLLLAGRFQLATTATIADHAAGAGPGAASGRPALLTHAGVTRRELGLLALDAEQPAGAPSGHLSRAAPDASVIATALNAYLERAVGDVAERWRRGAPAALDLAPLHVAGTAGEEGGGLLYHRPARRDPGSSEHSWSFHPERPRRFDPSSLPAGLLQIAAHTGHRKCVTELERFVSPEAALVERVSIRTLRAGPGEPRYELGVDPSEEHGSLVLIEPGLAHGSLDTVELLPILRRGR